MSETPRTDLETFLPDQACNYGPMKVVPASLARRLEKELTAANLALKEVREKVKEEIIAICEGHAARWQSESEMSGKNEASKLRCKTRGEEAAFTARVIRQLR